jgi:hypothetical protein
MHKSKNRIVYVEAHKLRIHPTAQRTGFVKAKLKKITEGLNLDALGTIHAVEYPINGETALWIIDGWHRRQAVLDRGLGDWLMRVEVHVDVTTDAQSSDLFITLNFSAPVTILDRFVQGLAAGYPAETAVSEILRRHSYVVGGSASETVANCPAALLRAHSYGVLEETLSISLGAWGHTAEAVDGKLIEGIGLLCAANPNKIDLDVIVKKLARFPSGASGVIGKARGYADLTRCSVATGVAGIVADQYNSGRPKNRLSLP